MASKYEEQQKSIFPSKKCKKCGRILSLHRNTYTEIQRASIAHGIASITENQSEVMKMDNAKPPQTKRIMNYMQEFGSITQLEAIRDLGIMRLASRVSELRKRGVPIHAKRVTVKNRFGEKTHIKRYSLKAERDKK